MGALEIHVETADLFGTAVEGFGARLERVPDGRWHDPTPCTEWDVRDLVNHVVSECRWVVPLLAGRTIAEVGGRLDGDLLGHDPRAAWRQAAAEAVAAVSEPGALERTVHLSFGDRRGDEYVAQVGGDVLIHTWDLARAVGGDERLDAGLVQVTLAAFENLAGELDRWRAAGIFGERVEVPETAGAQARLLGLVGRRA